MEHSMMLLVFQLAVIVIAARLGGFVVQRFLRGPGVLGELAAGMLLGPYALGGIRLLGLGPLFPPGSESIIPVSPELYGFATLAAIVLLFASGLETDLATFMRYSTAGIVVGIGGIVFAFVLGDYCAVWFGLADSFFHPAALFMGTVATATSVGLTARILSERRSMGSPEGVTILAAAVFDDVFGIIVLGIVVGMTKAARVGETFSWAQIGILTAKALGFWLFFTAAGLLLARRITRVLKVLRSRETIAAVCLGLALLLAGLSETVGLAMIIGAFIMGLSLSRTDLVYELQEQIRGLYNFLIPIFFCVMGMLVDFGAMRGVVIFGLVYTALSIVSKIAGCALPAWLMKFTPRGAMRVGVGMVPRGEVALIVAGIGLSSGAIGPDGFGVSIIMVMLTTLVSPVMVVQAFRGGPGIRTDGRVVKERIVTVSLDLPSASVAEFLCGRIMQAFHNEEFFTHLLHTDIPTYQILKEDMAFTMTRDGAQILMSMNVQHQYVAKLIILEELLALQDLLDSVKEMRSPDSMGAELLTGLFSGRDAKPA